MKIIRLPLLLLAIAILIPLGPVHADAAPPPAPGLGGIEPFHYQTTEVQMVYERVEMEMLRGPSPIDPSIVSDQVSVTAWFVMHNTGHAEESMQVVFPLDDINSCLSFYQTGGPESYTHFTILNDSFTVSINNNPVSISNVISEHPYNTENYCQDAKMDWAGFDVTFPVDQDVLIRVHYLMEADITDYLQYFQYILETGAGWKGPIGQAYIVVHFPYLVSTENIRPDTTQGYNILYDEIYWSYKDIEPTRKDNINVSFISPAAWEEIQALRSDIRENPHNYDAWINLAKDYEWIGVAGHRDIRDREYYRKADTTYQQAIAANPNNAQLNAQYAYFLFEACCYYMPPSDPFLGEILPYLNKALALDPNNETANGALQMILNSRPDFTFTPPPTIPPTITFTPTITSTPTVTPLPSITPIPTNTFRPSIPPLPTKTRIPTRTPLLTATTTPSPTSLPMPWFTNLIGESKQGSGWLIVFALALLAGAGFITLRSVRSNRV